jgi:glycosyltransferase involved in cell wall biosynthesis
MCNGTEVPEVSVVMPVRNAASTVGAQLEALAHQDYRGAWELIVVDDKSVDGTDEVVQGYADRLPLTTVELAASRGVAHARNQGWGRAGGDKVLFCDADDVADPGWMASMVDALEHADLVGGRLEFDALNAGTRQPFRVQAGLLPRFLGIRFSISANLGVRRALLVELGGFDEELLPFSCEDIDLSYRAGKRRATILYEPDAVVHYRLREDSRALARQQIRNGRGEIMLCLAYRSDGLLRRLLQTEARLAGWLLLRLPLVVVSATYRARLFRFALRKVGWVRGLIDLALHRDRRRTLRARAPTTGASRARSPA